MTLPTEPSPTEETGTEETGTRRGAWVRLGLLAALVVASAGIAAAVGVPNVDQLRRQVEAAGIWGPVVFGLIYAASVLAPVTKIPQSVAAGVLFGLVAGSLIVIVSATVGALLAFGVGRVLGQSALDRLGSRHLARLQDLLERRGLVAVLIARLVPLVPFTAVNYAFGATRLHLRDYAVGTVVGIMPGTIAYVALGRYGTNPTSWQFGLSVAVLLALTVGGWLAARRD